MGITIPECSFPRWLPAAGASGWLQRPETARGRRFPTARAQPGDAGPPTHHQNLLEEEVKEKKKGEEKKSLRREDGSPELKLENRIKEEAEKERGHLVRKKEKLLQQEEEGGRRRGEEDEERPR